MNICNLCFVRDSLLSCFDPHPNYFFIQFLFANYRHTFSDQAEVGELVVDRRSQRNHLLRIERSTACTAAGTRTRWRSTVAAAVAGST